MTCLGSRIFTVLARPRLQMRSMASSRPPLLCLPDLFGVRRQSQSYDQRVRTDWKDLELQVSVRSASPPP